MYTLILQLMNTSNVTYSITDLRHKTSQVLKDALELGYINLVYKSKTKAALVDIEYLRALQEAYEDYLDTIEFDKTVNLKRIPLETHIRKFKKGK